MKNWTNLDNALRVADRRFGLNVLRIGSAVKDGETVTFGTNVFEVDFNSTSQITAGNIRVNLSGSGTLAAATKTGTFSGVGTANDTIVLGATTYKLVDTLTGVANEVLIGGSAGAARDNFVAAVNAAAGAGTTYGTGTVANASVSAAASSTADVIVTAKAKGTVGNSIAISETSSSFSFAGGATNLSGGADATADDMATALAALTVANVAITKISSNEVLFVDCSAQGTIRPLACSETLTGSNNAWHAAATYGFKAEPDAPRARTRFLRVPNAGEVALGNLYAALGFVPTMVKVTARVTSTGAPLSWGGTISVSGRVIKLTNNATNDWATTHTLDIEASE